MKIVTIIGLLLSFNVLFAYDAVIKDKYGRRGNYIESDGEIKDKYGRIKGKILEKD